jgi:hypothetical protein
MIIDHETDLYYEYKNELENCLDYTSLKQLILEYSPISPDLMEIKVESDKDYQEIFNGIKLERQKISAGKDWYDKYAPILLPYYIFRAQLLSDKFQVPCGLAYLQMCAGGLVPGVDCELAKQGVFKSSFMEIQNEILHNAL